MTQRTVTAMPAIDTPIRCCHCQRSHAAPTSFCTGWLCYSSGSPRQPTTGVTWAKIADELDRVLSTRSTARPTRSGRPRTHQHSVRPACKSLRSRTQRRSSRPPRQPSDHPYPAPITQCGLATLRDVDGKLRV